MSAVAQAAKLDVRPLTGALGAEVRGLDVESSRRRGLRHRARVAAGIQRSSHYTDRDISRCPKLREFGLRWGKLDVHGFTAFPGLRRRTPDSRRSRSPADHGAMARRLRHGRNFPPKITMLLARQLPAVGGDTMFASQYKAYEDLSDAMKAFLDPLNVEHDGRIIDPTLTNKSVTHPLVITHPETGRKAIFVNLNYAQRVVQLEAHESRALLDFLFLHC